MRERRVLAQRAQQPRLADAGLAGDGDDRRRARLQLVQRLPQPGQLTFSPDHRAILSFLPAPRLQPPYSRAKLSRQTRPTIDEPTRKDFAGRYRIVRELGRGASKTVVLAHDLKLDRDVALCLIAGDPGRVEREAKVMGRLGEHVHIATIYDWGEADGHVYMVVRHLAGGSLAAALAAAPGRRLPVEAVRRVGRDVADALAHAHAHGVVHRDVKPDNVWLTEDGTATLGDFGLALAAGRGAASGVDPGHRPLPLARAGARRPASVRTATSTRSA